MTDFFREVDEELRNERMKSIWNRYRFVFIGVLALIILGTAAYRGYLFWTDREAAKYGDQYLSALEKIEAGDREGANQILQDLSEEGFGQYPVLADFRLASSLLAQGDRALAIEKYEAVAGNSTVPSDLQDYASLQAARIALDEESYEEIVSRVGGLVAPENAWRDLAREVLALSAWRAENLTEAAKWVSEIKSSLSDSPGVRDRARVLEDLIIARGGTLPTADTTASDGE